MDFSIPCQIHQLSRVILYINNFLPCQLHIFFNKHLFTSKIQRWNKIFFSICLLSFHSLFLTFIIHGKIGNILCWSNFGHPPNVLKNLKIYLSPHLRASHNIISYIRHCFPQFCSVVESNWELTHSKSFFLYLTLKKKQLFLSPKVVPRL